MDFNVNHEVFVRLTDEGRSLHRKAHDELEAHIRSVSPKVKPVAYQSPKEDEDGWSKWLLWELMASFGEHMYNGCRPPFELDIRIPDTALEAKRDEKIERLSILLERQIVAWRNADRPMSASNLAHELALARNPEARSVPDDPQETPT